MFQHVSTDQFLLQQILSCVQQMPQSSPPCYFVQRLELLISCKYHLHFGCCPKNKFRVFSIILSLIQFLYLQLPNSSLLILQRLQIDFLLQLVLRLSFTTNKVILKQGSRVVAATARVVRTRRLCYLHMAPGLKDGILLQIDSLLLDHLECI